MRRSVLAVLLLLTVASCSRKAFDGRIYDDGRLRFGVGPIPNGWRPLASDARLAFRDENTQSTIAVNARCGLDGDDVPLTSLTHHLFLHFTDRKLENQQPLTLDGRDALRTELSAELDGVPQRFVVVVLKKNGCVYDFWRISAPGTAPDPAFDRFIAGFRALEEP
jgi:hypothetical protein